MFKKILIANRGEIACRIARTLKLMGIQSVGIFSTGDRFAQHAKLADESYALPGAEAGSSYLNIEAILKIAIECGAEAIHPGYGFLSENEEFAKKVLDNGLKFIGPSPTVISLMGDKLRAKELAHKLKIPLSPSIEITGNENDKKTIKEFVANCGFPLLVKAAGGGGGRGMRKVLQESDLEDAINSASREAKAFFNDPRVFVEKLVTPARHVEVQILGDSHGNVVHIGDRDCSYQRRHQKVIEEAPAPGLPEKLRMSLWDYAISLGKASKYEGLGTVEFLIDRNFQPYFLEVNSRLQVEHPVTEQVSGLDLVELQIRIAAGESIPQCIGEIDFINCKKHAIECRLCAEDPANGFSSATGQILELNVPSYNDTSIRFDTGFVAGDSIQHYFDSLLGKIIVTGLNREECINKLGSLLSEITIVGLPTNIDFLTYLVKSPEFSSLNISTSLIDDSPPYKTKDEVILIAVLAVIFDANISPLASLPFRLIKSPIIYRSFIFGENLCEVSIKNNGYLVQIKIGDFIRELTLDEANSILFEHYTNVYQASSNSWWVKSRLGTVKLLNHSTLNKKGPTNDLLVGAGEILAPLPGKVVSVLKNVGDSVREEEKLLVIESMKMEHIVKSPFNGIISEAFVLPGKTVGLGEVLITIKAV